MSKIELPHIFTKETWKKYGSLPVAKDWIGLPRTSWSQVETFKSRKSFNLGKAGWIEWTRSKLLQEEYPDAGWGLFGNQVQEYIQERKHKSKFNKEEKKVLDTIKPLDIFEKPMVININGVVVVGYIDDLSADWKEMVDYKTKSESSKKDLFTGEKHQGELYSLFVKQEKGFLPKFRYVIIERIGGAECYRGGGRECLTVGKRVWYEDYPISESRLEETTTLITEVTEKMSDIYKVFKKLNKL